jgi:branched-chain amino acid transport system substrate-binding protein
MYADNPKLIGIVGPWGSDCAFDMLPILNTAAGGPPSLVAPLNSSPDLVRTHDDLLGELYPMGKRGYAQLYPADDYDVAAGVLIAKQQGKGGVYYLEEKSGQRYVPWMFEQFEQIARRAGVKVAGHGVFDQNAKQYRRLARRIRDSGAGAVYTPAGIEQNMRAMLRDLRATLDPDVEIIGMHHLTPVSLLVDTVGAPARGVLITRQGLQPQSLGPAGQRFVREFGATQPGHQVNNLDVYAAAATEVLLDAIARSDGTREGVARALKHTRLADSVIGPLALQPNGEPVANPITYARVERGGSREDILLSIEGAKIMGVITPPASLVGG